MRTNNNNNGGALSDEDEDANEQEVVIDEEELSLLREMKDLKRNYRENFDKLKQTKLVLVDTQTTIDQMKQQIVFEFEQWYADEFDNIGT